MFGKKKAQSTAPKESLQPLHNPEILGVLQRLEKSGVQITLRLRDSDPYASEIIGLGHEAFFVDTLSPPLADQRMQTNLPVSVETIFQGTLYSFDTKVLGKVQFVDELPAFKLAYPKEIHSEIRRKSPRIRTSDDATLSFLYPFPCDAIIKDLSEGGLAFEYDAERGRLRPAAFMREVLVELGAHPVINVQARVACNLVCEIGGIGLPRRYRAGIEFEELSAPHRNIVLTYLTEQETTDDAS